MIVFAIVTGIVIFVILIIGLSLWGIREYLYKENPDYIVQFLEKNVMNNNVSLFMKWNGESWVEVNKESKLPLASTVKIIVAIEYARQLVRGQINPEQIINVNELNKFYIPKTDGGAHENWLKQVKDEDIPLKEVVMGMITYSSNANFDYLIHLLGLENINKLPGELGLVNHSPIYPIVSALYIPFQVELERDLNFKEVLLSMEKMSMQEYRHRAMLIFNNWLSAPLTDEEKENFPKRVNEKLKGVWSSRLPRATTQDYVSIMDKLNRKIHFEKAVYEVLDPIMEELMTNEENRKWLQHAGQKGGSTPFVYTIAMYATDLNNNQCEVAFFSNDLNPVERIKLSRNMNGFLLKFLKGQEFRGKLKGLMS